MERRYRGNRFAPVAVLLPLVTCGFPDATRAQRSLPAPYSRQATYAHRSRSDLIANRACDCVIAVRAALGPSFFFDVTMVGKVVGAAW